MCILIHHSASTSFSDEMLNDFYTHNPDGFGVMYGDGHKIHVTKSLGTVDDIIKLYRDICEGRDCIIHFRMKTHGAIDTANCHPYRITDQIWLAHNGVLSASNPIDNKMSDTWHLIEYVLRPIAESNPDLLFDEDWQRYAASLIGSSNKLGICHADGRVAIINRKSGVEYMDAWLSNTYAWSAAKHGVGTYKYNSQYDWYTGAYGSRGSLHLGYDQDEEDYSQSQFCHQVISKKQNYKKVERAAFNCWMRGEKQLEDWVITAPEKAAFFLKEWYQLSEEEAQDMVNIDPDIAVDYIADIFASQSVSEAH